VCTVVTRWRAGAAVRILAVRDEFVSRAFDDPGEWWPDQPGIVGGRDRVAGGSWCVSDVAAGTTALVLNRTERHTGTPSRGVLPLAAVAAGHDWPDTVDHTAMASFTLLLAGPNGVTAWTWDAEQLRRAELAPGTHITTSRGVDADDGKTARYADRFAGDDWPAVITSAPPADDRTSLVVRHEFETDTYATVLGQLIDSRPGSLEISYSRTPWQAAGWTERSWSTAGG
jgi:transport and Golgi organization protein 2